MKNCISKTLTMVALVALSQVSVSAYAATAGVGKAIISIGKVTSKNKDGVENKLKRRGKVFEGDTITVGKKSRLQLRFIDNQLVVLKANTVFRIDEYKFKDKKDQNKSASLSLLKGGMRSVTGLIGKSARDKYKVKTPVATMGVRGTHYVIQICSGDCGAGVQGIVGTVLQGAIVMSNDAGTQEFGTDQFFNVPSNNETPKTITNPPRVLISRATTSSGDSEGGDGTGDGIGGDGTGDGTTTTFSSTEQTTVTTTTGTVSPTSPFLTGTPAPAGAILVIAGQSDEIDGAGGIIGTEGGNALIDLATINGVGNQPVSSILIDQFGTAEFQVRAGAVATEQGGDMLGINWGRWATEDILFKDNGVETTLLNGFAFVYSPNPTTPAQLAGLTGAHSYVLSGGPSFRDESGVAVSGVIQLDVDFMSGDIFSVFGSLSGNGRDYSFNLDSSLLVDTMGVVPLSDLQSGGFIPLIGGCMNGDCGMSTLILGDGSAAFVGPNAERLIGYFGLNGTTQMGQNIGISGAGVFNQGPLMSPM